MRASREDTKMTNDEPSQEQRFQDLGTKRRNPLITPASLAEEPSRVLGPVQIVETAGKVTRWVGDLHWGSVESFDAGFPFGGGPYKIIHIFALDGTARHDWREFQQLKNQLAGEEWEGLELYPAESRLRDVGNAYLLWCVPPGVITWGLPGRGRHICDPEQSPGAQRAFSVTPADARGIGGTM